MTFDLHRLAVSLAALSVASVALPVAGDKVDPVLRETMRLAPLGRTSKSSSF